MERKTVLFVCSFNSVRSQMAEGFINARCPKLYLAESAGIAPAGLNPYAVAVMKEAGIDISKHQSKKIGTFAKVRFDYLITLCDRAKQAGAGILPPAGKTIHRAFDSPSEIRKNKNEILADFRVLRDEMGGWLDETFPDCTEAGAGTGLSCDGVPVHSDSAADEDREAIR